MQRWRCALQDYSVLHIARCALQVTRCTPSSVSWARSGRCIACCVVKLRRVLSAPSATCDRRGGRAGNQNWHISIDQSNDHHPSLHRVNSKAVNRIVCNVFMKWNSTSRLWDKVYLTKKSSPILRRWVDQTIALLKSIPAPSITLKPCLVRFTSWTVSIVVF